MVLIGFGPARRASRAKKKNRLALEKPQSLISKMADFHDSRTVLTKENENEERERSA
jgi:hypothetical protein